MAQAEAPWTAVWCLWAALVCGVFAVLELPGLLFLGPWLLVSRAGWPRDRCRGDARCEGCPALCCREFFVAGSRMWLL